MGEIHKELTDRLLKQNKWLEDCTDTCKGEADIDCINNCGSRYMKAVNSDYSSILDKYIEKLN